MKVKRAYRYELDPNVQQRILLAKHAGAARFAYNWGLAQRIADVGWGEFRRMLAYKCGWYGSRLVEANRHFPSSKMCSCCGKVLEALPLDVREWDCPVCGTYHDRDVNAAKNLLALALAG